MAAAVVPRRRRCGPKVKSGCQTCKIRRVKCDEAKPACLRCTRSGRKCDGYLKDILSSNSGGLVLVQRISACIPGSTEEKRGFSYFLNNTSSELSGYYDSSFWQELLLQASATEPALRHALIGIGSLHESFANKRLDYSPDNVERGFAINQYTKAIGHLRRSLAAGNQQPLTALMSCILFVCFDSIRGHFESAMVHLQSGLKILRGLRIQSAADEHIIAKTLAPAFMRLSIQAILYVDTTNAAGRKAFAIGLMEFSARETSTPEMFATLEEARNSMNQATSGLFRMLYMYDVDLPFSSQAEIFPLYEKYSKQLADWNTAFERFVGTKSPKLTSKEVRGAAMLKIQHTTASIMANLAPPCMGDPRPIAEILTEPAIFIPYLGDFETIIKLSRSIIAASEEDSKTGKSPLTFSTDLGLVGPLYYCCVKSPDHTIRMAAMELLMRCPRREGMWDSVTLERLIRGYWGMEASHQALQQEFVDDMGQPIALDMLLDLVIKDGMKWEWKWKEMASRNRESVARYTWAEVLEDRSRDSVLEREKGYHMD